MFVMVYSSTRGGINEESVFVVDAGDFSTREWCCCDSGCVAHEVKCDEAVVLKVICIVAMPSMIRIRIRTSSTIKGGIFFF